ncbi:MAG: preprotein translocase subunit SecG [Paracoccaceae bacterium]|nr:preprotein translocase subunit SecG [Paracoccaceae bacterium]
MENVILVIHLILAVCLISVVLLQRSEGGGLGMGGGGGGGVMSGRQAATALAKLTWIFAGAFFVTSIALTVIAAGNGGASSVMDNTPAAKTAPAQSGPAPVPQNKVPAAKDLLPPSPTGTTGNAPATPAAPPRAGN